MSHIYRSLPPGGTRIGIAFSGGLDTRAAVAWLAEQGLSVHATRLILHSRTKTILRRFPPSPSSTVRGRRA